MSAATDDPSSCSERVRALRDCTAAERAHAVEQLGALMCSVQAELLDVITAADAEGDWVTDGATAMAPWLVGMLHVSSETARSWVKVGAALDRLPVLREVFSEGLLSWDQVKPAVSFVTPDTDAEEAQRLQGLSAAQVEDLARQHRAARLSRPAPTKPPASTNPSMPAGPTPSSTSPTTRPPSRRIPTLVSWWCTRRRR